MNGIECVRVQDFFKACMAQRTLSAANVAKASEKLDCPDHYINKKDRMLWLVYNYPGLSEEEV